MFACKSISKAKLVSEEDVADVKREVGAGCRQGRSSPAALGAPGAVPGAAAGRNGALPARQARRAGTSPQLRAAAWGPRLRLRR